ncbi:hypothetical protein FKP32DRAFT_1682155 [Trametes sanguinea]|nr:hypothetical protein FKP32DRAFT_1682155 [Trametes sanguinea]
MDAFPKTLFSLFDGRVHHYEDVTAAGPDENHAYWVAVHISLAEVAPRKCAVVTTPLTAMNVYGNVMDTREVAVAMVDHNISFQVTESTRTLTYYAVHMPHSHLHHLRFEDSLDFWECVRVLAVAKAEAEAACVELHASIRKVSSTFPPALGTSDAAETGNDSPPHAGLSSTATDAGVSAPLDLAPVDATVGAAHVDAAVATASANGTVVSVDDVTAPTDNTAAAVDNVVTAPADNTAAAADNVNVPVNADAAGGSGSEDKVM